MQMDYKLTSMDRPLLQLSIDTYRIVTMVDQLIDVTLDNQFVLFFYNKKKFNCLIYLSISDRYNAAFDTTNS